MSGREVINAVNGSGADFLVAALGAKKGQLWLHRNHKQLTIPVRAHLGATVNFLAGTVKRAPRWQQAWGLEWLWRIKEEPHLWRRYWHDGRVLLRLLVTQVLPLAIINRWNRYRSGRHSDELRITSKHDHESVTICLSGDATEQHVEKAVPYFQKVIAGPDNKIVAIDLSGVRFIDARFLGLMLMLRKQLMRKRLAMRLVDVPRPLVRLFRLNGLGFLVQPG